jgi:hypothetical protein
MNELKEILKERKQHGLISDHQLDFSDEIFNSEDLIVNNFLKEKTLETQNISAKGSLALGKVFSEVFEKLQGSKTYEKFIQLNGFNRRTALRHRKRFEIFKIVPEERKPMIAMLPMELIEKISNNEEELLPYIENGISREELETLIQGLEIDNTDNMKIKFSETEKSVEEKIVALGNLSIERINSLEEGKKYKINNLLKKIEKILGEY